jgi:hypothetical protein
MKPIKIFVLAAFLITATLGTTAFIKAKHIAKPAADDKGFVVVELYTSEGCSSCPPADNLVSKIQKENADKPVYILAYHVDYWNRLGWKDQFSSADFSKRQNDYANYLHINSVYTPQIVINGQAEFVGSEEGTLRNAVKTNLQKAPWAQLTLNAASIDQKHADLKYTAGGTDKNTVLEVAVLQKNAQTKVLSGENGGHTLSHIQIVRKLQEVKLNKNGGSVSIPLPKDFDAKSWEIIGFLQNTSTGIISAATRVSFPTEVSTSAMAKGSK